MTGIRNIDPSTLHTFPNMSKAELQAVNTLDNNTSITIKPADKGGATVILDTEKYRNKCLSDVRNYDILPMDPTEEIRIQITNMVQQAKLKRWITKKEATFLVNKNPVVPYFYILPKVHKDIHNPPGRP